jgi:hypothetical protein
VRAVRANTAVVEDAEKLEAMGLATHQVVDKIPHVAVPAQPINDKSAAPRR